MTLREINWQKKSRRKIIGTLKGHEKPMFNLTVTSMDIILISKLKTNRSVNNTDHPQSYSFTSIQRAKDKAQQLLEREFELTYKYLNTLLDN